MKSLTTFLTAAAALMAVGCAKDGGSGGKGSGILTVGVKSEKHTRALVDATNTDPVVTAFEDNVYGFSAYVFNYDTGNLEAKATSPDGAPVSITGLNNASKKRVVVIANGTRSNLPNSFIPEFVTDAHYSRMAEGYLALADQTFTDFTDLTNGFVMTGESADALQLLPGANSVSIPVKRVVSKVELGEISFDDTIPVADLAVFNLSDAMIQRAAGYSDLVTGAISTPATPSLIVGGDISGSVTKTAAAGLTDQIAFQTWLNQSVFIDTFGLTGLNDSSYTPSTVSIGTLRGAKAMPVFDAPAFWYVLPNADPDKFTLMTLKGSYNGTPGFYPIEINDADADVTGPNGGLQNYVQRNTIYKINLHFKNLAGIADPDLPGVAASIDVTVVPQPWEGPVVQNSIW